jgi:hypothetical protein
MTTKEIIKSQYRASLEMLREAVFKCADALWYDEGYENPFWHIAYHALFFTHLYLQDSGKDFVPWAKHRHEYEFLGTLPWPPHREPDIGEPYTKEEVLEFLGVCQNEVEERVTSVDLEAASGFDWLPFGKLELQFYNIRHLQHHTGQLVDRLRARQATGVSWVAHKSESSDAPDPA